MKRRKKKLELSRMEVITKKYDKFNRVISESKEIYLPDGTKASKIGFNTAPND